MVQKVVKVESQLAKIGSNWLLLLALLTFVSSDLLAQKPIVALTIDQKNCAPGERVTITVTSNVDGTIKVDYPVDFEVDYGVMHGMEQKMDAAGKIKTFYYMQQSGTFRKEGNYSFYAYVNFKNANCKSNKLTVKVDESFEEDNSTVRSDDPVFGIIQCKKHCVYEGEAVLLKAKVFSQFEIINVEGYAPFKCDKNIEEHVFQNQKQYVERTKLNGKPVEYFEYGKQLIFPVSTGKCKIQPFEMALRCQGSVFARTVRFGSAGLTLFVKPLPSGAPVDFIGGVGQFDLTQELGNGHLKKGDVFTLKLVVSGTGNLHNTNAPRLKLPTGCKIYGDPERKEDFQFTEDGAEGTITYLYNIQVSKMGQFTIDAPSISYFDPAKEKYVTVGSKSFILSVDDVQESQQLVTTTNEDPEDQSSLEQTSVLPTKNTQSDIPVDLLVGVGAPVAMAGLLFLFLRNRKKRGEDILADSEMIAPNPCSPTAVLAERADFWKDASTACDDQNKFAVLLPKAIIQQVQIRMKCTCATRDKAFQKMADNNAEVAQELRAIIDECDHFRYGFGATALETHQLLRKSEELLNRIVER